MRSLTTHLRDLRLSGGAHVLPYAFAAYTDLTHGLSVECKWENQTWKMAQRVEEGNGLLCSSSGRLRAVCRGCVLQTARRWLQQLLVM